MRGTKYLGIAVITVFVLLGLTGVAQGTNYTLKATETGPPLKDNESCCVVNH
jgi:hypothetical protein